MTTASQIWCENETRSITQIPFEKFTFGFTRNFFMSFLAPSPSLEGAAKITEILGMAPQHAYSRGTPKNKRKPKWPIDPGVSLVHDMV